MKFYGWYVDDTMTVLKLSEVQDFTDHLNSFHPSIKFTVELEDNHIAMLDTLITRQPEGACPSAFTVKALIRISIFTSTATSL